MTNDRTKQRRAAWHTSQPRGRCTMDGLHARPVPTTHVVKWPRGYFRRLSGEPIPLRAYTCRDHAEQLRQRFPPLRVYRYRVTDAEPARRAAKKRALRTLARALALPRALVSPPSGGGHWADFAHWPAEWEARRRRPGDQWHRLYHDTPAADPGAHMEGQRERTLEWWRRNMEQHRARYEQRPPELAPDSGGWCAPADITCLCGATDWPHECALEAPTQDLVDLAQMHVMRGGLTTVELPPLDVAPGDVVAMLPRTGPNLERLAVDAIVADVEHCADQLRARMHLAADAPITVRVGAALYQRVAAAFADHPTIRVEQRPQDLLDELDGEDDSAYW